MLSLRGRLLAGMVVLVTAGLTVAAVATYEEQRTFLLDRVDQQVGAALVPLAFQLHLFGPRTGPSRPRSAGRPGASGSLRARAAQILPAGTVGELLGRNGAVLRRRAVGLGQSGLPLPALPRSTPTSTLGGPLRLFTARSRSGESFRAAAVSSGADTAVVAVPLREADDTLARLVRIEILVGAGVLVALIGLGRVVIGIGLRPLRRMEAVAGEIAAGDLSRRVSPDDNGTEVGRLGLALNEMLGQIEEAFAARRTSEERLRRFVADASHELRTPLAAIRGYADLFALGAAEDPEVRERAVTRIGSEAQRMGVLVEDLLLLAAVDREPSRPATPVALSELVHQAAADIEATAPDRQVRISADGEPVVLGDRDRIAQLINNLIRNAVVHTPAGTAIDLSARREGESAVLAVRDHGDGLPQGAGDQLFERFWRPEGGRARGAGGSGLGLAIVQAIAVAHGGTVNGADAPGGGAVFTVRLPAADPSQQSLSLSTPDSYPPDPQ